MVSEVDPYLTFVPAGTDGSTLSNDGSPLIDAASTMPVRLDAYEFRGLKIRHNHDLASDQLLGRVARRDPGDQRALVLAVEDGQLDQLFRSFDFFRGANFCNPQIDLHELIDRDLREIGRCRLRKLCASASKLLMASSAKTIS